MPKPIPYDQVAREFKTWEDANPSQKTSVADWSKAKNAKYQTNAYDEGISTGAIARGISSVERTAQDLGASLGGAIRGDHITNPNDLVETLARGAEMAVSSSPSMGASLLASRIPGSGAVKKVLAPAAMAAYGYTSGMNQANDPKSALVNAASMAASPWMSSKGAALGKRVLPTGGEFLGGAAGGFVGDAAEILSSPTANPDAGYIERAGENIDWFKDLRNLGALALSEAPMGAAGYMTRKAQESMAKRESTVRAQRGLQTAGGKASDVRGRLENEHQIDFPEGITDLDVESIAQTLDADPKGDGPRLAQIKAYSGRKKKLTEFQTQRKAQLEGESNLAVEYADGLDRDEGFGMPYKDEIGFAFNDNATLEAKLLQFGLDESDTRRVGRTLFYRGKDEAVKAELNRLARKGIAPMFSKVKDTSLDAEHKAAVESGDFYKAQQLVNEAARRRGYTDRAYHGMQGELEGNKFSDAKKGDSTGALDAQKGFFSADHPQTAESYGDNVLSLRLNPGKGKKTVDMDGAEYSENLFYDTIDKAWKDGSELVEMQSVRDGSNHLDTVYVAKNPSQMKDGFLATYDDDGNIIPLSKRFDSKTDDIRYSKQAEQQRNLNLTEAKQVMEQADYDKALAEGEEMSTRDFAEAVHADPTTPRELDVMTRVLEKFIGKDRLIKQINKELTDDGSAIQGFSHAGQAVVNLKYVQNQKALTTAGHEMTHVNLERFRSLDPEGYSALVSRVSSMDLDTVKSLFRELNKTLDLGLDVDYQSGSDFKRSDPNWSEKVAQERLAVITEALIASELQKSTGEVNSKGILSLLPIEVQRFLRDSLDSLRSWFTGEHRMGSLLSAETKNYFDDLFTEIDTQIYKNEKVMNDLQVIDQSMDQFSEDTMGTSLQTDFPLKRDVMFSKNKELNNEVTMVDQQTTSWAQKNLWSMLGLARAFPQARDLADALHNFRPDVQKTLLKYWDNLGQDSTGKLTEREALQGYEDWTRRAAKNPGILAKMGKVIKLDQEAMASEEDIPVVTREAMIKEHGLAEQDADMLIKMRELGAQVAHQEFLDMSQRDTLKVATYLNTTFGDGSSSGLTSGLNKKSAETVARLVTQQGSEMAKANRTLVAAEYRKSLHAEGSERGNKAALDSLEAARNLALIKEAASQSLASQLDSMGVFGVEANSPRIRLAIELASKQAEYRFKHVEQTTKEGYFPQTRRGDYILRYTGLNKAGERVPLLAGYTSQKAMNAGMKELEAGDVKGADFEGSKKDGKESYRHYASSTIQGIRDQFRSEINGMVGAAKEGGHLTPEAEAELKKFVNDYGSMDTELSNALGTKSDPFKLQRKNVGGFKEYDYVPNMLDYIQIKTIIGKKGITQARADLELSQKEMKANKDLSTQFAKITDYTLNSDQAEYTPARKLIYMHYLGGSIRHFMQNITQPTIVGLPHLIANGISPLKATKNMTAAYKQVTEWNHKGTTGNKELDRLMKQAEDDHVWAPSIQDSYTGSGDIRTGAESANMYQSGKTGFLRTVDINRKIAGREVENYLKLTGETSEKINRQIGFAMRVNGDAKANATTEQATDLYRDGVRFTNDINFVGDKSNRPGFVRESGNMHGTILTMTALQSFTINHLSLLGSYWHQVKHGSVDPKTFKLKPDAFRLSNPGLHGLLTSMGTLVGFAGLLGLPFTSMMDDLVEDVTGIKLSTAMKRGLIDVTKMFDEDQEWGSLLADSLMDGVASQTGVGVGKSVGLGNPLGYQAGQPASFYDIAGAGGAIVEKGLGAVKQIAGGPLDKTNWAQGWEAIQPTAFKYWSNLKEVADDNVERDNKGKVVSNPLDGGAQLSRALGFTPYEVGKNRATEFEGKREMARRAEQRSNAVNNIAGLLSSAERTGSQDDKTAARKAFSKYKADNSFKDVDLGGFVKSISNRMLQNRGYNIDRPNVDMREIITQLQGANPDYQPGVVSRLAERKNQMGVAATLGDFQTIQRMLSQGPKAMMRDQMYEQMVQNPNIDPSLAWALTNNDQERIEALMHQEGAPQLGNFLLGQQP